MERPENIHTTIAEIKKRMGLDKIPNVQQPIPIKKDGKHLYQVCGFTYPLRPETIERLKIPPQKILFEVERDACTKKWMKPSKKTKTLGMIRRQCKPPFFVNEAKHCKSTEIATESPDVLYKRDSNDLAC